MLRVLRDALIAKHEHAEVVERLLNPLECRSIERAEMNPLHLGPNRAREGNDPDWLFKRTRSHLGHTLNLLSWRSVFTKRQAIKHG